VLRNIVGASYNGSMLATATPWAKGGTLASYLHRREKSGLPIAQTKACMRQLLLALDFMHRHLGAPVSLDISEVDLVLMTNDVSDVRLMDFESTLAQAAAMTALTPQRLSSSVELRRAIADDVLACERASCCSACVRHGCAARTGAPNHLATPAICTDFSRASNCVSRATIMAQSWHGPRAAAGSAMIVP
jgi:serine/threonine protein kinase